jgi:rsbT co-antagonist protein RsbR
VNGKGKGGVADVSKLFDTDLLNAWLKELKDSGVQRNDLMREAELQHQCREFIDLLASAARSGTLDIRAAAWSPVRDFLNEISRSRALQGATPTQTAMFVFSLKRPLFDRLRAESGKDAEPSADQTWAVTQVVDELGLLTVESFQKTREEVIGRQQQEMLELSTPVVKLWEGVLALPMIGTLDSARTQVVMETLLQRIIETGAEIAIIDITGVPTVDTLVAQHLLKTVTAARLMGADCIISGIRPQIAQTIVHLGVDLADVITKASLADAFALALKRSGYTFVKSSGGARKA